MCVSELFASYWMLSHTLLRSPSSSDIDAIITKGERDTKALNDKMAEFTDEARKFTMDGGLAYDFKEDEDDEVSGR